MSTIVSGRGWPEVVRIEADLLAEARRRLKLPQTGPFSSYSRFVAFMKVLLPSLAVVLLGLVVVWPRLALEDKRFQVGFASLPKQAVESLAMKNARYYGLDDSNRPFAVSAELAVQEPGNPDLIRLTLPKADFVSSSGSNILMDAAEGLYHQNSKMLDLSGGVSLYHDAGYELHTATATMDLGHSSGYGSDPVEGHGPQGKIRSEGFKIVGKGREIIFTGKAQLGLRAASAKGQGKKGAAKR